MIKYMLVLFIATLICLPQASRAADDTEFTDEPEISLNDVPAGSFVEGVLITGVEFATHGDEMIPVEIQTKGKFKLPDDSTVTIKNCFITGSAIWQSDKTERIRIRTEKFTCMNDKGVMKETAVRGYIVDSDNTLGLKGTRMESGGIYVKAPKSVSIFIREGFSLAASKTSKSPSASNKNEYCLSQYMKDMNAISSISPSIAQGYRDAMSSGRYSTCEIVALIKKGSNTTTAQAINKLSE